MLAGIEQGYFPKEMADRRLQVPALLGGGTRGHRSGVNRFTAHDPADARVLVISPEIEDAREAVAEVRGTAMRSRPTTR